jgi:hypothetical protein
MSAKRRQKRALQRRLNKIDQMPVAKATAAMAALIGPERAAELAMEAYEEAFKTMNTEESAVSMQSLYKAIKR